MDTALDPLPADAEFGDDTAATPPNRLWRLLVIAVLALAAGALGGYWLGRARVPAADSVDVGFARDMSLHHEQAVVMAGLIYDRTDDPAIRTLAFDILTTQQGQIGIMSGWLDAWGLPWTSSGPRMAWMGMPTEGLMPGMATGEQLAALRAAAQSTAGSRANTMPFLLDAVRAYATLGEITDVFREVFGTYEEPTWI